MTDHPNATDYRNRAERAEAEANELRAALKVATDGLQAVCDCDVSDPVDYVRRCDAVACEALVKIEALA